MAKRPVRNFAGSKKIGAKPKKAWICMTCGAWFDKLPAKVSQCRGSGVTAHRTDAQHFPSQAEAGYYMELRIWQAAGKIKDLQCQPVFPLIVNGVNLGKYIADFSFIRLGKADREFIDVKGNVMTEISDLRRRLAEAIHGVKITIVRR